MLKHKSTPQVVPSLDGLFIENIAVGCEHVLALSCTADVYAWGCNSEGQVTINLSYITHFHSLKWAFSAHPPHFKSRIVGVCFLAWPRTLQPSEGAHAHHGSPGEEH